MTTTDNTTTYIGKFDAEKVSTPYSAVILGRTGCGKTTLAIDLIRRMNKPVDNVCVLGKGDGGTLINFPDDMDVCEFSDYGFLRKVFDTQCEGAKAIREKGQCDKEGKNGLRHICVVLEDFHDQKFLNSELARELLMNGRHLNISLLILTQSPFLCEMPRDLRTQIDICCVGKIKAGEEASTVHAHYCADVVTDAQDFNDLRTELGSDGYHFMVCDNTANTNVLSDAIKWYKVSPAPATASAIATYHAKIDALCGGTDTTISQVCSVDAM